jgi:protein ImuB
VGPAHAGGGVGPAHAGGGVGPAQAGGGVEVAQAGRVSRLALVPEEVRPDDGRQLGFWGNDAGKAARAARALARVQALLGPEAALTAVLQGGRDHHEQVLFVPWGEPRVAPGATRAQKDREREREKGEKGEKEKEKAGAKTKVKPKDGAPPWPGRLPGLAPAIVHCSPLAAQVLDEEGNQVSVGSRGVISAPPAWVVIGQGRRAAVGAWAGPWPLEERWWEAGGRRRARLQVRTDDGRCYLLAREKHRWWVEATYD